MNGYASHIAMPWIPRKGQLQQLIDKALVILSRYNGGMISCKRLGWSMAWFLRHRALASMGPRPFLTWTLEAWKFGWLNLSICPVKFQPTGGLIKSFPQSVHHNEAHSGVVVCLEMMVFAWLNQEKIQGTSGNPWSKMYKSS